MKNRPTAQTVNIIGQPGGWNAIPITVLAPAQDGGLPLAQSKGAKVLVVEDDHLVAMMTESALLDAGFDIAGIAVTSAEAIALARAQKPDLVIMDITLHGDRDGVDTAIELFRESGIRCIFATAHHDGATRRRAQAAQPISWLAKPYQPDALVHAVQNAMSEMGKS